MSAGSSLSTRAKSSGVGHPTGRDARRTSRGAGAGGRGGVGHDDLPVDGMGRTVQPARPRRYAVILTTARPRRPPPTVPGGSGIRRCRGRSRLRVRHRGEPAVGSLSPARGGRAARRAPPPPCARARGAAGPAGRPRCRAGPVRTRSVPGSAAATRSGTRSRGPLAHAVLIVSSDIVRALTVMTRIYASDAPRMKSVTTQRQAASTDAGDLLALDRQVCFALAVASRNVIGLYRPLLEPMGLTHPQYLVMLALWEEAPLRVSRDRRPAQPRARDAVPAPQAPRGRRPRPARARPPGRARRLGVADPRRPTTAGEGRAHPPGRARPARHGDQRARADPRPAHHPHRGDPPPRVNPPRGRSPRRAADGGFVASPSPARLLGRMRRPPSFVATVLTSGSAPDVARGPAARRLPSGLPLPGGSRCPTRPPRRRAARRHPRSPPPSAHCSWSPSRSRAGSSCRSPWPTTSSAPRPSR